MGPRIDQGESEEQPWTSGAYAIAADMFWEPVGIYPG